MTTTFTQSRADEICAAVHDSDVGVFVKAVAFSRGVVPTQEAVAQVSFPADFAIDASTFSGNDRRGSVRATVDGSVLQMSVIFQSGEWKLDSTGSSENISDARL